MRVLTCAFVLLSALSAPAAAKDLPEPYASKSVKNFSHVIGWKEGETPLAPSGFTVSKLASGFHNPRWLCQAPNGDILVAESNSKHSTAERTLAPLVGADKSNNLDDSADRISVIKPDGQVATYLDHGLNQPFGMLFLNGYFYVANTDALLRFRLVEGKLPKDAKAEKLLALPAGKKSRHWTRSLLAKPDGSKLYIGVGSSSNVGENGLDKEVRRACILEVDPDGANAQVLASGLRNPVGLDFEPATGALWCVVNERDELGDELVPDYLTRVQDGGYYGWPFSYWGEHRDPRRKETPPKQKVLLPDVDLGSHVSALGLAFYTAKRFPPHYRGGAFVGEHGSWNRKDLAGYKVVYVPFQDGQPSGPPEDFLAGFQVKGDDPKAVHGRPVGLLQTKDGSLLLADDTGNTVWKISAEGR